MSVNLQAALATAETLAKRAGALLRSADLPRTVDYKSATDLVTEYDRQSEVLITDGIRAAYPDHAIVGEESSASGATADRPDAPYRWYIDPLDGTTNFVHGWPHYCVSIALCQTDKTPIVGVLYDPWRDECFTAIRGGGALLNGSPIHVSATADIERSLLVTSFANDKWHNPDNNTDEWTQFILRAQAMRCSGSSALDLAYVAAGRVDGSWQLNLKPWDVLAGLLIVQEAGGRISSYRGTLDGIYDGQKVVASNGLIHERLLTIIMMGSLAPRPVR